ncbi:hypothetical protein [Noviherbaspirillum sp. UKPF54]|uniref:hypothetical protein n=1 Tax=Noviherbaspirillum sp. UKPF54 TaxID=2601898 RepID=UPI0011B16937|nr:hypothetical protein FAY22_16585 [Noviherbaspirillum sp. UKPF54]
MRRHSSKPTRNTVALFRIEPISDIGLRMFFSDGHLCGIDTCISSHSDRIDALIMGATPPSVARDALCRRL